jgi:hypothetical protein
VKVILIYHRRSQTFELRRIFKEFITNVLLLLAQVRTYVCLQGAGSVACSMQVVLIPVLYSGLV